MIMFLKTAMYPWNLELLLVALVVAGFIHSNAAIRTASQMHNADQYYAHNPITFIHLA